MKGSVLQNSANMLVAVQYLSCLRAHGHWAVALALLLADEGFSLENSLQPKFAALQPFNHDKNIFTRISIAKKTRQRSFERKKYEIINLRVEF